MPDNTALFDWLTQTLDDSQDKLTIVLNVNGNSIDTELTVLQKEVDSQGRIVTVKRTTTTHLRIARKGRTLHLAR